MKIKGKIKYDPDLAFFLHKHGLLKYFYKISNISPSIDDLGRVADNELHEIGLSEDEISTIRENYRKYNGEDVIRTYLSKVLLFTLFGLFWVLCSFFCNVSSFDSQYLIEKVNSSHLNFFAWGNCAKEWFHILFYAIIFFKGLFCLLIAFSIFCIGADLRDQRFGKDDIWFLKLSDLFEIPIGVLFGISPFYFAFIIYRSITRCEFDFFSIDNLLCIIHDNGIGFVLNAVSAIGIWSWFLFIPILKGVYQFLFNKKNEIDVVAKENINLLIQLQKYIDKNSTKFSVSAIILSLLTFLASLFGAFADGYSTIENIGYVNNSKEIIFSNISFQKDSLITTITNQADFPITINSATFTIDNLKIEYENFGDPSIWGFGRRIGNHNQFSTIPLNITVSPKINHTLVIDSGLNEHFDRAAIKLVKSRLKITYNLTNSVSIDGLVHLASDKTLPVSYQNCKLYFFANQIKTPIMDNNVMNFIEFNSKACNCK